MTYVRLNAHNLTHNTGARHPESLKKKAIVLRRRGHTYSEILQHIPVVKSTLSLWLAEVGLSKKQKQHITAKKLAAARRGGEVHHQNAQAIIQSLIEKARNEVGPITQRELFLIGVMLYWAEGSKQRKSSPSAGVRFINSDPQMMLLFMAWLQRFCNVARQDMVFEIYLHENHVHRLKDVISYWSKHLRLSKTVLAERVYFKRNQPNKRVYRQNTGKDYYGILNLRVRASSHLNRRITGWIQGIVGGVKNE